MIHASTKTIAVLYPGELGARVGGALVAGGERVITTLAGRGDATRRRCEDAGITVLPTLSKVVVEADVVLSLVPPAAAEETATRYVELAHAAPIGSVYVDLNSIGPALAKHLGERVESDAGRAFVDGAINGLASRFADGGTLFLSGSRAGEIAALFDGITRVRVLGDHVGAASAMKMLLGGLSKGVCALFAELAVVAQRQDMLDAMLESTGEIYPELLALARRMLPTYAQHAHRRAEEMRQLESTVRDAGFDPVTVAAARELHEQFVTAAWDRLDSADLAAVIAVLEHRLGAPLVGHAADVSQSLKE